MNITVEFEVTRKHLKLQSYISLTVYEIRVNPQLLQVCFHRATIVFLLDAAEVICGQSEVQLAHHQADGGELGRQRVPALETHQLLLHLAP